MDLKVTLADSSALGGRGTHHSRVCGVNFLNRQPKVCYRLILKNSIHNLLQMTIIWFFQWSCNGCESWTIKKAEHWRIDVFELWCWRRLFRVPWTARQIHPVHPKRNQSWIFIGRMDVEAETPILWPHDAKSWLTWKDPDAGKDWRQEEKWETEDEMVGWHHWLNGHEFE